MNHKHWVLVFKEYCWATPEYAAKKNPRERTKDINEAQVFRSLAAARDIKRHLCLPRRLAPRAIPAWLA